ncbi:MAG TPA: D-Ala-D-Ala carboxypeptidase family metallohydrolase [Paraburkholderia sp.]|uniref:D-Ala-D-Ala carboxypeptidase family metallohydrolase n=1 Tax=Paraburkholderia sp. TaxID=1926495 RepID=UPI002B49AE80|nr:D-Ala-D-Ala carboxypeptidase family metallohydrolase [Paraburkholderia sp.]HKR44555.1 D-Ala-D-Ala carboxypeptidase family metallohydrolase [Paraburkholderia sp.]
MRLSPHFSLDELIQSETATRHGISNQPGPAELDNLVRLADVLELVRTLLRGRPMLISSGYRAPGVNRLVGGAPNSDHMSGRAADFICPGFGSPLHVCRAIDASIPFDQLIFEGTWVHLSIPAEGRDARRQVLTAHIGSGPVTYTSGLP